MEQTFSTLASVVQTQYELHLHEMQRSAVGVGSETWFLRCEEVDYVIKFPAASRIHHPEAEPEPVRIFAYAWHPRLRFFEKQKGKLYLMECRRARIHCTAALSGCDSGMEPCIEYTVDGIGRTAGKDPCRTTGISAASGRNRSRLFFMI